MDEPKPNPHAKAHGRAAQPRPKADPAKLHARTVAGRHDHAAGKATPMRRSPERRGPAT